MSRTIKEQMRVLVKEHERGLLPDDDYRRLRNALLQRAAVGETHAAEEPTATRPREPKARPPEPVAAPAADPSVTAPRPPASQAPSQPPAPRPKPAAAPSPRKPAAAGSKTPLIVGGAVLLMVAIGAAVMLTGGGDSTDVAAPAPVEESYPVDEAGELVAEFIERGDWAPGQIRRLMRDWEDLPDDLRADAKFAGWYRELARELRDRLKLSELSDGSTPTATTVALKDLATSLDLRVQSRFESTASMVQSDARDAPAEPTAPAPDDSAPAAPQARRGNDTAAVATRPPSATDNAPATRAVKPGEVTKPETKVADSGAAPASAGVVATTPVAAVTPPPQAAAAAPEEHTQAAQVDGKASAGAAASKSRGSQCGPHLLSTRRKFCRDEFLDGSTGPKLALIRPGRFTMGSDARSEEQPTRAIVLNSAFAVATNEVSFAEYRNFCTSAGRACPVNPWGDDTLPVVSISWGDARDYAAWLAERSGQPYRLPTEAEWEYAARAGSTSDYPFGDEISYLQAHYSDTKRQDAPLSAEGALIPGNRFGLKHVVGNVGEWVQDAWADSYAGAPTDGSARQGTAGSRRVVRGGSYRDRAADVRSASRVGVAADSVLPYVGLRVARSIE